VRIDSHQHFWRYNAQEYGWIGPDMDGLRRDFLPDHLHPLLRAAGVDGTIAVQARQSTTETAWLLELAERHPFIRGVVGWVDLCSERVSEDLERFAHPLLRGVRHVLQDEPDPLFMLRDDFDRGVSALGAYGLTYDLLLRPEHLPAACDLVARHPDQPFVLDHIAKPRIREGILEPWRSDLRRLAEAPHVHCKASGLLTEADWRHRTPEAFHPYLDAVLEAFGPQRVMAGSDWPVCTLAGTYAESLGVIGDYVEGRLGASEQEAVLGGNAMRFYGLEEGG